MVSFTDEEIYKVLSALPLPVVRMLRMSGLFLAGGFIRAVVAGEKPSDIDIFSPTVEVARRYAKILAASLGSNGAFESPNAITISKSEPTVQFITRWLFNDPVSLINSFDFTVAQASIHYEKFLGKWVGLAVDEFEPDTRGKILRYTSPTREEDAAGSLLRANKFIARGYTISDEDLAKVVARVGVAALEEKKQMFMETAPKEDTFENNKGYFSDSSDPVEPYRRVIKAARPSGGGSV